MISGEGVSSHVVTVLTPTIRDTAKLVVFVVSQTWLTTSQCGGCCSWSSHRKLFRVRRGCCQQAAANKLPALVRYASHH